MEILHCMAWLKVVIPGDLLSKDREKQTRIANVILRLLYMKGANPDIKNEDGEYPLHLAIRKCRFYEARILVRNGANPNMKNREGNIPLHLAVAQPPNEETNKFVEWMLSFGNSSPNIQNNHGDTPLHEAVRNKNDSAVELLLENGANPNIWNDYGNTPLHESVLVGEDSTNSLTLVVMLLLLGYMADPNIQNKDGEIPLDIAKNIERIGSCRDKEIKILSGITK